MPHSGSALNRARFRVARAGCWSRTMAGYDWERELRKKVKVLARGEKAWRTLDKAPETTKKMVLEEADQDVARDLVEELIKRAFGEGRV